MISGSPSSSGFSPNQRKRAWEALHHLNLYIASCPQQRREGVQGGHRTYNGPALHRPTSRQHLANSHYLTEEQSAETHQSELIVQWGRSERDSSSLESIGGAAFTSPRAHFPVFQSAAQPVYIWNLKAEFLTKLRYS
ncbi:hypothetical protein CRENBAI_004528, partial [Crenichthys baileyi]